MDTIQDVVTLGPLSPALCAGPAHMTEHASASPSDTGTLMVASAPQDPTPSPLDVHHGVQLDGIINIKETARAEYINLLVMLDDASIPAWWNLLAIFFVWILLVGFVLLSATFATWEHSTSMPVYIVACTCTTIGEMGMLCVWWAWRRRYAWLLRFVFGPGLLGSITGIVSIVANNGLRHTIFLATSRSSLGIVFGTTLLYSAFFIVSWIVLLRRVARCRDLALQGRFADENGGLSRGLLAAVHCLWSNQRRSNPHSEMPMTEYVRMHNATHDVPMKWNIISTFLTWILLIGFVLSSVTISPSGTGGSIALYVVTGICIGAGAVGMTWAWWKWHKNYVWILHHILLPSLLNSFIGIISILANVYGAQHGVFTTASKVMIVVTTGFALVCAMLFDNAYHRLSLMKRWHRVAVFEQASGRIADLSAGPRHSAQGQDLSDSLLLIFIYDGVPAYWISSAALSSRLLLFGFVLLPVAFSSWESSISRALYVMAWIFTGVGVAGMTWTWWKWRRYYAWISRHVLVPGLLNSLTGIILVPANVYGARLRTFSATSVSALIITAITTLVFVVFSCYEMSLAANAPPMGANGRPGVLLIAGRTLSWLFDIEYLDIIDNWDLLAIFSAWILLVGLVLFPASFSFQENSASSRIYTAAWVCTAIGIASQSCAWLRWRKDYVWTLRYVFIPGLLNSLTGLISILANVYGAQNGSFSATSTSALIVSAAIALVCGVLARFYSKIILKAAGWHLVARCPFSDRRRLTSECGLSVEAFHRHLNNSGGTFEPDQRRPIFNETWEWISESAQRALQVLGEWMEEKVGPFLEMCWQYLKWAPRESE